MHVHAVLSVAEDCGLGRGDRALSVWHKKKKTKNLTLRTTGAVVMPNAPAEPRLSKQKPTVFF